MESAARSQADAVFLDLEDAVPPAGKAEALRAACHALETLAWGDKTVAARVNAFGSPTLQDELSALGTMARLDAILLPKAERVSDVRSVVATLAAVEGVRQRPPIEIDLLIETALGLVNVESLVQSDARVGALHLGVGDLAASIGARSGAIGESPPGYRQTTLAHDGHYRETSLDLFAYPMMRVLVAARAFGVRAIDGPCGAFRDLTLTRAWAEKAAALGFDGKQVIHPTQIDVTCDAFVPSADELAFAHRVVEAMSEAEAEGKGAVAVDGKMIDYANARIAARVIKQAGR